MSFRAWVFIIAIGLGAFATLLEAQEETESREDRREDQEQPAHTLPFTVPVQVIEDDESTISREAREAEASQREIDDLEAQQGMNAATQAMNEATQSMKNAAWVSTVFVGAGTALLIWTLALTRQANKAAQDAVDVTRVIGQAQARAYLHVKSAELRWLNRLGQFPGLNHQDVFAVDLEVENAGQTPAIWYEVSGRSRVRDRTEGGNVTLFETNIPPMRWGMIASNASLTCPFRSADMLPQFIEAGKATQRYLRIDGVVKYLTEFNEQREVPFSFYVDGLVIGSFFGGPLDHAEWRKRRINMTRPKYGSYE